jgi:hypothetical protein
MGGMRMSLTKEETILPKAAPMMMPTAMSSTLPRRMNFLNASIKERIAFFRCRKPAFSSAGLQRRSLPPFLLHREPGAASAGLRAVSPEFPASFCFHSEIL